MKFFNSSTNFESVLKKYFSFKNETLSLDPFAEILESVKRADFTDVLNFLKSNPEILKTLNITFIIFLKEGLSIYHYGSQYSF
jgi:hypothetical protein